MEAENLEPSKEGDPNKGGDNDDPYVCYECLPPSQNLVLEN